MPELTSLETIPAFDAALRRTLAEYWITSAEEFVGVARSGNARFGSGLAALAEVLGQTQDTLSDLVRTAQAQLPDAVSFAAVAPLEVGVGAIFEGMELPPVAFDLPTEELPAEVWLGDGLPTPANQGKRNTCVAFTLVALYQQAGDIDDDLSEQFLHWLAKSNDRLPPPDRGTRPDLALRLLRDHGVCREATWPYQVTPAGGNDNQGPPPAEAAAEARTRRISGFKNLQPRSILQLKAALAGGRAILIGLPINEHWTGTWQSRTLGRVRKPLPGEGNLGGHAMCALGYRDDPAAPGGGYFIVRNSWGVEWGSDNPDGAGYAHVPYQLVFESNLAAFVIEEVVIPASPAPPARTEPESPPSAPPAGGPQPAPTAAAAPTDVAVLRTLYEEAREQVRQAARLALRLRRLLDAVEGGASLPIPAQAPATPASASPTAGGVARGPLVLVTGSEVADTSEFLPANGIDAATGQPLLRIDRESAAGLARQSDDPPDLRAAHHNKDGQRKQHLGPIFGVNEDRIDETGWALVVPADEDAALLWALAPLIAHRAGQQGFNPQLDFQAGERCGDWLARHVRNIDAPLRDGVPVLLYQPGESCDAWLQRHKVSQGPVDPRRGVPFYLLLAGRPGTPDNSASIPFAFQYELDLFWGVGRVCFTTAAGAHDLAGYTAYAEQVVAAEAAGGQNRRMVYFGTRHNLDPATERSASELVQPLAEGYEDRPGVAARFGFTQQLLLGADATRDNLDRVLRGELPDGAPALLFSATHGIGLRPADPQLFSDQGALVCHEWTGFGSISREHWFAAADLSAQTRVHGLVAIMFACYGLGCPQEDQFVFKQGQTRPQIAPYPIVAQLPQELLRRGALAVLGHVDRAWSYGFSSPAGVAAQYQGFEDVLARIMSGKRMGFATDQFNMLQGALATRLTSEIEYLTFGRQTAGRDLTPLWIARNDARNYALLGDPAVRLAFE